MQMLLPILVIKIQDFSSNQLTFCILENNSKL